ncbi:hypothetical protein YC2023_008792 [Brassica napus]
MATATQVMQAAKRNMTDETKLNYDFRNPFVICGSTYIPICRGQLRVSQRRCEEISLCNQRFSLDQKASSFPGFSKVKRCQFHPDSGEREFRSVLGPTGNKLQRKLPEMKLKKKKKKHMKSKYEKTKNLGTPASPTTTLKQRKKLFVAQARSQGITVSRTVDAEASLLLPDFSVVSNVFKKKQDSEQSTAELALQKDDDDITVEQAWDDIVQRVKFLSADHPLGSHLRATLQRDGERHGSVHVMSSLHLIQRSTIAIKIRASHERTKEEIVSRHAERCWLLFGIPQAPL